MIKTVPLIAVACLALSACGGTETPAPPAAEQTAPKPQPSASKPAAASSAPTVKQIVDRLAKLHSLPNPRDNTATCAPTCRGLITTDAVSVYDWGTEANAKRWASPFGTKVRRVGPYVLSFNGSTQAFTSKEARAKMAEELRSMLRAL